MISSDPADTVQYCPVKAVNVVEKEKAWHLLAILLSIGRPVCAEELAFKCELFVVSADFVRNLCLIPNSPICLLGNGLVTVSIVAVSVFREFMSRGFGDYIPRIGIRVSGARRSWDTDVRMYFRKRKGVVLDAVGVGTAKRRSISQSGDGKTSLVYGNRIEHSPDEEPIDTVSNILEDMGSLKFELPATKFYSGNLNDERVITPLLIKSNPELSSIHRAKTYGEGKRDVGTNVIIENENSKSADTLKHCDDLINERDLRFLMPIQVQREMKCKADLNFVLPDLNLALPRNFEDPLLCKEDQVCDIKFRDETDYTFTFGLNVNEQCNASLLKAEFHDTHCCEIADLETQVETAGKRCGFLKCGIERDVENVPLEKHLGADEGRTDGLDSIKPDHIFRKVDTHPALLFSNDSSAQKQLTKSISKQKGVHKRVFPSQPRVLLESFDHNKALNIPKQQDQCKSDQKLIHGRQKLESRKDQMDAKENIVDINSTSPKNGLEGKTFPHFDSFIVEEEEGSGGYGIVYRAVRKNDGKRFAIKCPHLNAHVQHVYNERKMLERFGGRNFIINYEGSFKSHNSECFVLEHVEHERPEVLKKEIDMFQLQWYGYCLFRALACLHKQGVVHKDVKPGNFLFSQKLNKGFLIDFNLAADLQQKYTTGNKSQYSPSVSFDHVPLPRSKSASLTKDKKFVRGVTTNVRAALDSKPTPERNTNMKKKVNTGLLKDYPDLSGVHIFKSQGADGSGITSTKDATSTRTPSTEKLREPLPCQGRKELINLVQGAMRSPNLDAIISNSTQRKRVTVPLGKVGGKLVYMSPMPLHSSGVAVNGAGLLKSKGDGKHKREGTCVGTKGFRAPEVLFRSLYQGPKVDVWSAGVTLLYLMLGRTPFTGDPEQNIKDIAKLRGSEDLWEVAKLHDQESSFPMDLLDLQYLPSKDLKNWCKIHTRRPEFFKHIPNSLFDLMDKCLKVNPRMRISAEEALKHEFFISCHESLRKQRMLRRGLSLDSARSHSAHLVDTQSQLVSNH